MIFQPVVPTYLPSQSPPAFTPSSQNDEVMQILLANEKKGPAPAATGAIHIPGGSDHESDTSESGDEGIKALPSTINQGNLMKFD